LSVPDRRCLALSLGHEELPDRCAAALAEVLACHVEGARRDRERENKTTGGNVAAALVKTRNAVKELMAPDSGIDDDTRRSLEAAANAFIAATEARLDELEPLGRIYPDLEQLRLICPCLRRIFEGYARPDFINERRHLRRFAFDALCAAGVDIPGSIDEAHLYRLDEFLDAELHPGLIDVPKVV
jgi:hypothetical protein